MPSYTESASPELFIPRRTRQEILDYFNGRLASKRRNYELPLFVNATSNSDNTNVMHVPLIIGETKINSLVDSGSSYRILSTLSFAKIKPKFVEQVRTSKIPNLVSVSGDKLRILGTYFICVSLTGKEYINHKFLIVGSISLPCILGIDFIRQHKLVINGEGSIEFTSENIKHKIAAATLIKPPTGIEAFQLNHLEKEQKQKFEKLL